MEIVTLLAQARDAGLDIRVEGDDQLVLRGPTSAEAMAHAVLARKPEVLALLRADQWRSPLAVLVDELMAGGLDEDLSIALALEDLEAQHAATCGQDPWLPDEEGIMRCQSCGRTAPPEAE